MAITSKVDKSEAIRDYLKAHPRAMPSEIATALTKQGIAITTDYAATIKATMPAAQLPKPAKPLTLEQIKMLAQAIKRIRLRGEVEDAHVVGEGTSLAFWRM